jgi:hypothetical protein
MVDSSRFRSVVEAAFSSLSSDEHEEQEVCDGRGFVTEGAHGVTRTSTSSSARSYTARNPKTLRWALASMPDVTWPWVNWPLKRKLARAGLVAEMDSKVFGSGLSGDGGVAGQNSSARLDCLNTSISTWMDGWLLSRKLGLRRAWGSRWGRLLHLQLQTLWLLPRLLSAGPGRRRRAWRKLRSRVLLAMPGLSRARL